jgi:hypothetical protein
MFVVVLSSIVIIFTVNVYLEGLIFGKFAEKYFAYFHYYVYFLCISPILKVFRLLLSSKPDLVTVFFLPALKSSDFSVRFSLHTLQTIWMVLP